MKYASTGNNEINPTDNHHNTFLLFLKIETMKELENLSILHSKSLPHILKMSFFMKIYLTVKHSIEFRCDKHEKLIDRII